MALLLDRFLRCNDAEILSGSDSPEHVPYGFQTPSQLLYFRHCQFFKQLSDSKQAISQMELLLNHTHPPSGQVAIIATVTAKYLKRLPFLKLCRASNLAFAGSLLSTLTTNVRELCRPNVFLLDRLDITEALNVSFVHERAGISDCGIDLATRDRETEDFESKFSSILQSMDCRSQHSSSVLVPLLDNHDGHSTPSFSEISAVLSQFLYWMNSEYLDAFLATNVSKVVLDRGPVRIFQVSNEFLGVEYISTSSIGLSAIVNWYQDQLVEQVLKMVIDEGLRFRLQEDLRGVFAFK